MFAAGLLVYGVLRQRTFYGPDGYADLRRIAAADWRSDMHLLWKPVLGSFSELGASLGLTLYDSALWLSVIGTSVGVAFCHAACRVMRMGRTDAALVTCLAGLCPAVVFFATVVERHGLFFAFAGLCTWLAAWFGRRPTLATSAALALGVTAAYAAHSTGILMLSILVPFAVARARTGVLSFGLGCDVDGAGHAERSQVGACAACLPSWQRLISLSMVIGVMVLAGTKLARVVALWLGQVMSEGGNFDWFMALLHSNIAEPSVVFQTAALEWIYPFLPSSLLWLFAFRCSKQRLTAIAVACGTLVYVLFTFAILGPHFDERGAYLLPLAWPFAFVLVTVFPRIIVWASILLTASLALAQVMRHDDHHLDDYAMGMAELASEKGVYLIVADPVDWESMFLFMPELKVNVDYLDGIEVGGMDLAKAKVGLPLLVQLFDSVLHSGRSIVMSDKTLIYLQNPRFTQDQREAGPFVLAGLKARYDFVPVSNRAFDGVSLKVRR